MGTAPVSLADALREEDDRTSPAGPKFTVDASPDGGEFTGLTTTEPIEPGDYENAFAKVYKRSEERRVGKECPV